LLSFHNLLLHHGYALLFVYVLVVSLGVPIPVDPVFLLMGAQAGDHHYSFFLSLLVALVPAVLGDIVWYHVGKYKGRSVLSLLCKLSLEPDTCVRKTETSFSTRGANALLFSKFIPGMSLVSVTLAGISRMPFGRFVLANSAGCTLWVSVYLGVGWLFHKQVDTIITSLGLYGRRAGLVIVTLLALYLAYKYFQRWRFIHELRVNRVTPGTGQGADCHRLCGDYRRFAASGRSGAGGYQDSECRYLAAGRSAFAIARNSARKRDHSVLHLTKRSHQRPCGAATQTSRV
jgi:membrane protein DedA with SNARE-associated domain